MIAIDTAGANATTKRVEISKPVGSLIFTMSKDFDALVNERIEITLQRDGNNKRITQGSIPLKEYLLIGTMAGDAIGALSEAYPTQCVVELVEHELSAIHMREKDLLIITLTGLTGNANYRIDAIEAPLTTDQILTYERLNMSSEHENQDFDIHAYDLLVLQDDSSINEINLTFDNGHIVTTTPYELRALGKQSDPLQRVKWDGSVTGSPVGYLQIPIKTIHTINIRKTAGAIVSLFMRHDQDVKPLTKAYALAKKSVPAFKRN